MVKSLLLLFILAAPFVQPGVKAEVVSAKDGVPIHYSVQGKGEPALVFVHCWSCDRHFWDNQVPVFAKNHRVVTLDLPGHGGVPLEAAPIPFLLREGVARCTPLGHSTSVERVQPANVRNQEDQRENL